MRVYRIHNDVNQYRFFSGTTLEDAQLLSDLHCTARAEQWVPPAVRIVDRSLREGDFYQFSSNILIMSPRATAILEPHFGGCGELLPLPYQGTIYTILNVTNCLDALAPDRIDEARIQDRLRFVPERLVAAPARLFAVPQLFYIFTVEGVRDPSQDVRTVVSEAQLVGLEFEMVWSDDGGEDTYN